MPNKLEIFSRLKIDATDLPRNCIRDFVRSLIVSGTLDEGSQIPSIRQLTALWNVHIPTVHEALTDLLQEGLIVRRHGKGTYVAEQIRKMHTVAVYCEIGTLSDPRFWFYRSVLDEVRKVLEERKIGIDIWVDPRKESERTKIMEGLENAACKRDIQGIIVLAQGIQYLHWARTIPLPVAELSPLDAPFAVSLDVKQMGEMSVARLAEMGCKTIGLISGRFVRDRVVTGNANAGSNAGFYEGFMGAVKTHGLKIKDPWMRLPPRVLSEFEYGDFGNKQFNALWNLKQRPEGILIEPDIVMEGVIPAMLQHQVQPDDLKIVMHRNQNHPLICPFPASVVISSERDCAEALVRQLDNQLAGIKRAPILVPYQFEK